MVDKGVQRGIGHRVHRVRANQAVHIQRVGIRGVFHAGGSPQQRNFVRALLRQPYKFGRGKKCLPIQIRGFGQRNGDFALQVFGQRGIQCAVHARNEEARHHMNGTHIAARRQAFRNAVRISTIGFQRLVTRKQQRQVHADAVRHQFGQCLQAFVGGRHFNHHIRAVDGGV